MSDIVQKLWGFCHTLRHDGIDYGDYIEQLTYLLFLKMADERSAKVPKDCDWNSLKDRSGTDLTDHYADILRKLIGQDLVPRPRRLALMNLFLHGVEPHIYLGDAIYEPDRGERYDVVLTNPPFGTKGANQAPDREDFTIETSNKQLNFVQHVMQILKPGGRAAMVLPDNCLFEGKAGEVFEILVQDCNLHTVLRLPRGTFTPYSQGVKANVIFFQKARPTEAVRIFDARSNVPGITKKERPHT